MSTFEDEHFGATEGEVIESMAEEIADLQKCLRSVNHQLRDWQARHEHVSKLLTDILFHLPPQAIKLEDGRVMMFVDPDPKRTLDLIQAALQRAFDAARSPVSEKGD